MSSRVTVRSGKRWLVASRAFGCTDLRQPEIQNLGMPALGDEDIGGLDVPMDDASSVGSIQCVGDLDAKRQYLLDLQWLATDAMLQRHAIQKLHDDEGLPVLLTNFVDGADVGMVQCRSGTSFAAEALQRLRVSG